MAAAQASIGSDLSDGGTTSSTSHRSVVSTARDSHNGNGTYDTATVHATSYGGGKELSAAKDKTDAAKYGNVNSFHVCGTKYIGWFPPIPRTECGVEIYV